MNELAAKISLFTALVDASAKPVNVQKVANDVIRTLELFEDRHDTQLASIENKE